MCSIKIDKVSPAQSETLEASMCYELLGECEQVKEHLWCSVSPSTSKSVTVIDSNQFSRNLITRQLPKIDICLRCTHKTEQTKVKTIR